MSGNVTNKCCAEGSIKDGFYLVTSTWPSSAVFLTVLLMIIVNMVTLVGNTFVIVALAKIDALKVMANNQVVISLAVADLLVGLLVMPCAIDSVMAGKWRCGYVWGKLNAFGNFSFCISSMMHLALLSVDRYIAISRPLVYSSVMTKNRARIACLLLWIYSIIWALPPLFSAVSPYECFIPYIGECFKKDWMQNKASILFTVSVVCGTYGVAVVVMCFVYAKIYITVCDQSRRISATVKQLRTISNLAAATRSASAKKGALTLLIVIGTYVACWSPFCLLLFAQMARGKTAGGPTADITTMLIGFANSACNPVIYNIRYGKFREIVKRIFVRKKNFFKTSWSK